MTTSTIKEETTKTVFKVGELYTNDEIIMLCIQIVFSGFVGVVVHKYSCCQYRDYYIGATDKVLNAGGDSSLFYTDSFRKFQGEVTLKS